ncbi:MAG: hypothetical protein M1825_005449 [Sarcosagium campestre]|nr:MAG: hypothetical protein M1825_005449 [Sarcosagium campestre]
MNVSELLSPPRVRTRDHFSLAASPASTADSTVPAYFSAENVLPPLDSARFMCRLPSPPVTPATYAVKVGLSAVGHGHTLFPESPRLEQILPNVAQVDEIMTDAPPIEDPILFPSTESASAIAPDQPLFRNNEPTPIIAVDHQINASTEPVSAIAAGRPPFGNNEPTPIIAVDRPVIASTQSAADTTASSSATVQPGQSLDSMLDPNFDDLISQHMAMHMTILKDVKQKPTRDEYMLALTCVPNVYERYAKNPRRWLQQERRILDERFGNANRIRKPGQKALAKLAPAPAASGGAASSGKKTAGGARGGRKPQAARAPRAPRAPRATKRTTGGPAAEGSGTCPLPAEGKKRPTGASREDVDFDVLADFCPPLQTLPANNPKSLKADWRGQALDLSGDPHRHLLHDAEATLAATLRLSCATYLCSKRRIFAARVAALRNGKEFRKTDSQQACKIDVNKASKLWTAFEKVGWLKAEHFEAFL